MIDFSQTGLFKTFCSLSACSQVAAGTDQCILTMEESQLSEYNGTAGRIPPPTSLVWTIWMIFFFFLPLHWLIKKKEDSGRPNSAD